MPLVNIIRKIITNKVILYLFSRYSTYLIQLITSIIIAVKLGPFYFGIWGFILLLINYFQITNFGISNSINILMVQYKNDNHKVNDFVKTSFFLISILCFVVIIIAFYYYFFGIPFFSKYKIGNLFYFVCLIAIMSYFNYLLLTIYRVRNRLFEIAFFQSIIPLLVFIFVFLFKEDILLKSLIIAYLLGHFLSLILFLKGKTLPKNGNIKIKYASVIINKGFYLFIYNLCFYLIIISSKTLISIFYSVEEFGFFIFSYTLANAVMLLLEAISFLVFPKIVDRLNSDDPINVVNNINVIRSNYVTLAHGFVYLALIFYPLFIILVPKFQEAYLSTCLLSLTVLLYTNAFGYNTYLLARNYEKVVSKISLFSFLLNIFISLGLVYFKVRFEILIFATMFSYLFYGYLCVYFGGKSLNHNLSFVNIFLDFLPFRLLIPYVSAIFFVMLGEPFFNFIPFFIFITLNFNYFKEILKTLKQIVNRPDFINI